MSMGVESVETELPNVTVETKSEGNILLQKENGILNQESGITFGSHGTEETGKKEVNNLPENSIPKDAVDEWPAPKQIHTFYMVKYRLYDDQETKSQLDYADRELKKLNQARYQLNDKIRAKKAERAQVYSQLRTFIDESKQYRQIIDEKRKEIEPLHQALGKLRNSNTGGSYICSSEEELNNVIKSLNYRIQHESIPLSEEKQLIREIKQLEGTREKVIANAVVTAKIKESHGEKESIQDQVKQIGSGLDGVRKEKKEVQTKVDQLDKEKKAIEEVIKALEEEEKTISKDRDVIYEKIRELRKQLDQGNAPFYNNRTTLIKARGLAANKDVEGLRDLANTEVDTFMSLWSSTKAFRDDYERRILPSLDTRQLSRDGRMRNPDEKPLVVKEPPPPAQKTEIVAKPQPKQVKEDSTIINQNEKSTKQQKEPSKEVPIPESIVVVSAVKDNEFEDPQKEPLPLIKKVDEAKLKELKREEEIAKAKQAQERKKKLAEKAAAKAAIKAQKEAEKKLQDREKKAAKKAAASVSVTTEEPTEATADMVSETGTADEAIQAVAAPKTKERKQKTTVRSRGKAKGPDSLSKILKRKKAVNYWTWAAAIAAILAVLLSALGYYYMM
ncbi:proton pump-interactor 1-like isoform X2 [Apium graveolens]|uniref:proton pump-interactor 1-like isoform X2 n=1 Tax=Apium graveolens TaxID=4045 RepID=UPI003D7961BD